MVPVATAPEGKVMEVVEVMVEGWEVAARAEAKAVAATEVG